MLTLLRHSGSLPRFHGNGFLQLPLQGSRRLHVWHPSLPPIAGHNATIHDHVWDMQSRVLLGSLTHRTYAFTRVISDDGPYDLYTAGEDGPDQRVGRCDVRVTGEYRMAAGSIYVFPAGELHESESRDLTATIMEKRPSSMHGTRRPIVVCPRGEPPVDAHAPEHQPSAGAMWDVLEEAVLLMSSHARLELETCLGE